jgi:hypothetical protein
MLQASPQGAIVVQGGGTAVDAQGSHARRPSAETGPATSVCRRPPAQGSATGHRLASELARSARRMTVCLAAEAAGLASGIRHSRAHACDTTAPP